MGGEDIRPPLWDEHPAVAEAVTDSPNGEDDEDEEE